MPYDKRELFEERGQRCECGCGKLAQDAHHALIGRRKRFPELDCPENILLVNHDEHLLRKFDTLEAIILSGLIGLLKPSSADCNDCFSN